MSLNLEHSPINEPQLARAPTREEVREYLDFHLSELLRRRDKEIIPALERMVKAHPRIADGDTTTAEKFAENRTMAIELVATAKENHKEQKAPWLEAGREVDDWKNEFIEVIEVALTPVNKIGFDYETRRKAIIAKEREEAARKAHEEAERKLAEARRALAKAPDSAHTSVALDRAAKAVTKADKATAKTQARVARTTGIYGGSMGITTRWTWKVDINVLVSAAATVIAAGDERPEWMSILMIDETRLRQLAMSARDPRTRRPLASIPGVEWVQTQSMGDATSIAAE